MLTNKWPPISIDTAVRTTRENPDVFDWTEEAKASRQWGVQGVVVNYHYSHGLSCEVRHPDRTIGHYDPSEIEVV